MGRAAIFTVQHDEDFFLPMWISYYSEHFDYSDMFILAHNCTDVTKDILIDAQNKGINVEYINTTEIFNHDWLNATVHEKQRELLNNYEYVVFTDCDEIIVPSSIRLKSFIDEASLDAYRCVGFNIIEDGIVRSSSYDKTLISKIPLTYVYGYHTATPEFQQTEDLFLYHLHRLDYQKCLDRKIRMSKEVWDSAAIANNTGIENRLINKQEFDEFFYKDYENKVSYPEKLKKIIDKVYKNLAI